MKRRSLLKAVFVTPIAGMPAYLFAAANTSPQIEAMRTQWRSLLPPGASPPQPGDKVIHSKAEWRKILGAEAYAVLRDEATERPGSSALNKEKREGIYACAGCELPLFTSAMKYDSGTGWPSFVTSIPDALATKRDFKLVWPRTEYHCARCGGHQGHLFDDGPAPTHQRWCNNGVALAFMPA